MGPEELSRILGRLGTSRDARLLVGPETFDDAAVLSAPGELALCFTADFISPIVDEPGDWGAIAAANSLSDVYAMGGRPLAALDLVCWPDCLPEGMLEEVLRGGRAAVAEGGALVVGGHTVEDVRPKYGLAVIGTVEAGAILRNRGARPGDRLYLGKRLGTGILSTAIQGDLATPDQIAAATRSMRMLNEGFAGVARAAGARALTDVTGFGLAGHLAEMLGGDDELGAELSLSSLPLLDGVPEHMATGLIPGGAYRNRDAFGGRVRVDADVDPDSGILLFDPQTSGGLLAAVPDARGARFEAEASARGVEHHLIGRCDRSGAIRLAP